MLPLRRVVRSPRPLGLMRAAKLSPELAATIQQMSIPAFERLWNELDEASKPATLRARCRTDRDLFCRAFFPELVEIDWSPVHREFLATDKPGWRQRDRQTKRARVAPRGSAKSTLKSYIEILHDIVYGLEICVLIFSTGFQLSEDLVKDIHEVLTNPSQAPEFHEVYGPFKIGGTQTQFSATCPDGEVLGTQVAAKSFGSGSTRGHRYAGRRPSKIVLDDTVNPKRVKEPEQRESNWSYLVKDIEKCGFRYTLFELVGTIQHPDDLVARVAKHPGWQTVQWANVIAWPERMDLWAKCRESWANLSDRHREDTARAFYAEHRAEMDQGAEVLWSAGRPLWELMLSFWSSEASFWSEDQNAPRDVGSCIFDVATVRRCHIDGQIITASSGKKYPMEECQVAIWLDPSSGGKRSDFPAIAVIAKHKSGWRFVVFVTIERRQPSAQHAALWRTWERFASRRPAVGIDVTGTQGLLDEAIEQGREERRKAGKQWNMPTRGYSLSDDKEVRIASMEPDIVNGWIEFADDLPPEVMEQLRDFPNGAYDDAIDAIERADWLLTAAVPQVATITRG